MDDEQIIALFYERSERAIEELLAKYGTTAKRVAQNILNNEQDAEEVLNDASIALWNSIPPQHPQRLSAYFCRIARNAAISRYRANTAERRNGRYDAALDELAELLPAADSPEEELTAKELAAAINRFLGTIREDDRVLFVRRYWFADTVSEIAGSLGLPPQYVSRRLFRTKKQLCAWLKKERYPL